MERIGVLSGWITDPTRFRYAIISGRRKGFAPPFRRIDIRPVEIKGERRLQLISHDGQRDTTTNLGVSAFDLEAIISVGYANLRIELDTEVIQARITKRGEILIHREEVPKSELVNLGHDRKKARLLDASDPIFRALGISDADGKLIPRRSDKFQQVDNFLRVIESVLPALTSSEVIRIADLGCGSAYLTFATQRYLSNLGRKVEVVGVDSRSDSCERNRLIAADLDLTPQSKIEFVTSEIKDYPNQRIDLVIALHACDTATDDALAWAVRSGAVVILAAPCCHHDLNQNLRAADPIWDFALRDGIIKERFADLITDSVRAQTLRALGFKVEIIEFVSGEHTPRNLMIRATQGASHRTEELAALDEFCAYWQIKPRLPRLLADLLTPQDKLGLS